FDYFAEEVFADESEDVQQFLLRISLLERVETGVGLGVLADANCRMTLPELVRRNVFVTVASDERGEEYRLHPLFQSFLRRRLRLETGRAGVAPEYARYGEHFLAAGQSEQGVRYLLQGEEFDRAAAVMAERGGEWIA